MKAIDYLDAGDEGHVLCISAKKEHIQPNTNGHGTYVRILLEPRDIPNLRSAIEVLEKIHATQ